MCRWKQELSRPVFVAIKIPDVAASVERPVMTTLLAPNVKVHLGLGYIDMRKGIGGLAFECMADLLLDLMLVPRDMRHRLVRQDTISLRRLETSKPCMPLCH